MRYTPNSAAVIEEILQEIGLGSVTELYADIPDTLKLSRPLQLEDGLTEMSLRGHLKKLAAKNISVEELPCFLGAGAYDHYIPAALDQLLQRSEFYTAYTPYQPEISQGILQSIFEYQSLICELTGMEVSNASMYDGGSALAEAGIIACSAVRKTMVIVSDTLNP